MTSPRFDDCRGGSVGNLLTSMEVWTATFVCYSFDEVQATHDAGFLQQAACHYGCDQKTPTRTIAETTHPSIIIGHSKCLNFTGYSWSSSRSGMSCISRTVGR